MLQGDLTRNQILYFRFIINALNNSLPRWIILFFLRLDNVAQFFLAGGRCRADCCLDANSSDQIEQVLDHIERERGEWVTEGQCEHSARKQEEIDDQYSELACHEWHSEELAERIDSDQIKSRNNECCASGPRGDGQLAALDGLALNQLGHDVKHEHAGNAREVTNEDRSDVRARIQFDGEINAAEHAYNEAGWIQSVQ